MQLAKSTCPPFLHPKDPFVLLKGDNLVGVDRTRPQRRERGANDQSVLLCRRALDVVTGVELKGQVARKRQAVDRLRLQMPAALGTLPENITRALALETLLFDPSCAELLDSGDLPLFRELQRRLEQTLTAGGNALNWVGQPPDPLGITRWDKCNPWLPVYLLWQANWSPAYAPTAPTATAGHSRAGS